MRPGITVNGARIGTMVMSLSERTVGHVLVIRSVLNFVIIRPDRVSANRTSLDQLAINVRMVHLDLRAVEVVSCVVVALEPSVVTATSIQDSVSVDQE
jgi:hypothetical protein